MDCPAPPLILKRNKLWCRMMTKYQDLDCHLLVSGHFSHSRAYTIYSYLSEGKDVKNIRQVQSHKKEDLSGCTNYHSGEGKKNALACLYFFKPITTHWYQTSNDAATLLLQNSVWGNAEVAMCILKTAHADSYRINVIDDSWWFFKLHPWNSVLMGQGVFGK